jgi:hypothetical protein
MARPKTIKNGEKLNLFLPKAVKQKLFRMASEQGKSLSGMVSALVLAETAKP